MEKPGVGPLLASAIVATIADPHAFKSGHRFDEFQRKTASPGNASRFQDIFGYIDVRHRLAQVKVPTIVLHSKHDQRFRLDQGSAIAAGIPGARFVPLDSRNHILIEHEPARKTCIETVGQFLTEKALWDSPQALESVGFTTVVACNGMNVR